MAFEVGKA
jgi:hypothetical protein